MTETLAPTSVEALAAHRLAQALAREAYLLDTHRYEDWLQLLDTTVRYRVPVPEWVRGRPGAQDGLEDDDELAFTYLDETFETLRLRVARLASGFAHGEMPPSMTARVIGTPLIEPLQDVDGDIRTYSVISSFTLHQTRHEDRVDLFAGRRQDVWALGPAPSMPPLLRQRTVHLIQRVLPRTFSTFF